jgi:glycosyltransferase involved in cell wall biosynthesis
MRPLVSILIPAYNAEKWLSETVHSALAQSWDNKEIIMVDDGSKDGTLALARTFESDIVRVFTQENKGAAATRNTAFSHSRGAYIQWLDADDLLAPDKISRQMETLAEVQDSRTLLSGEWGSFMHRPARAHFNPSGLWCHLTKAEWLMRKMEQNVYMQTATWLVSRELTEAAGPWDTRLLGDDDGEYFCRVLLASNGVRFVQGARVYYRQAGPGSLSYIGESDRKREAQWTSMELHIKYLLSVDNGERARVACVKFLQTWMINFYPERMDIFEKARKLSTSLGGRLQVPALPWKYSWVKSLFGWRFTLKAQRRFSHLKWSTKSRVDRMLSEWEGRRAKVQFDES